MVLLQYKTVNKGLDECLTTQPGRGLIGDNNLALVNQKLEETYKLR